MTRPLILDVVARKNSKDLNTLADDFDRVAKQTDDFGKKINKATTFTKTLDDQIIKTKAQVKSLGAEFDKTGDKDVFANLAGAQRNLKSLEKIKSQLSTALDDGAKQGGLKAAGTFAKALTGGGKEGEMGAALKKALLAAAPIAAPAAGAAIGGAILAGIGLAGIGAGIAGQLHDPAVQSALAALRKDASTVLTDSTSAFGPVLQKGIEGLDTMLAKQAPGLKKTFDSLAPDADKLFSGFDGFIENSLPGLETGLKRSGVVIDELGKDLPKLGSDVGAFFVRTSSGSQGAADAIGDLTAAFGALAKESGSVLSDAEGGYQTLHDVGTGNLDGLKVSWKSLGAIGADVSTVGVLPLINSITGLGADHKKTADAAKDNADQEQFLGDTAASAAVQLRSLSDALGGVVQQNLSADESAINQQTSMNALSDSIKENGRAWTDNSDAALANRQALLAAIGAAEANREQQIANHVPVQQATDDYNAQVQALLDLAGKGGDAKAALDALAGEYKIYINATLNTAAQQVLQSSGAGSLAAYSAQRRGLALGGVRRAAVGMILPPSNPGTVLAGEPQTGGEVLAPLKGISQQRAMSLAQVIGDSYGFDAVSRSGGAGAAAPSMAGGTGGGEQVIRVIVQYPDGQVIQQQLLKFGRRSGYRTIKQYFPGMQSS